MATKAKKPVKRTARKTADSKQQRLACGECGLVLSVDEMCGCGDLSSVLCCGAPMETKR